MTFKHDGLNRQVSRTIGGTTTYNVYDGWDLIEEYQAAGAMTARYVYGAGGLILDSQAGNSDFNYYYQDGSGSTSHIADSSGHLLEWYRYDLQGTPIFYDANDNQLSTTNYSVRHLFTGQQWYSQIGLYDLRNSFYSPDLGRFLQPDPIGFDGDSTNLYRYCGNNPVMYDDPLGLLYLYRPGQFVRGVGAIGVGTVSIGVGAFTEEFIVGFGLWVSGYYEFKYGVNNIKASFSDNPADAAYQNQPSNLGGLADASAGGETGQVLGETIEDVLSARAAKTIYEKVTSGISVFQDGYNLGSLIGASSALAHQGFSPNGFRSPGGETGAYQDESGRIIVWATPIMPGDPVNGTSGIRDGSWGGFYTSTLSTTLSNPFGSWGPSFGGPIGNYTGPNGQIMSTSIFGSGNWYSGLDPISAFPDIYDYNPIGAMEPGIGPGSCFVAGTPVLMADGSEKPIESIQIGESVLAWNEETKAIFPTKVVSALHHQEKMQTLFDIGLEDGRKFTVNNDHPMYVVEDGDFTFTDELAARFAKGEPITFQDNKNQPVKLASLRMRNQICKMYNLHVEGQGKNGHTYYANGILVHNSGAGYRFK